MDKEDESRFRMPEVTEEERALSPEEYKARYQARWDEMRRTCSYILIFIALFTLLGSPLFFLSWVFVIVAFLIWPYPKSDSIKGKIR